VPFLARYGIRSSVSSLADVSGQHFGYSFKVQMSKTDIRALETPFVVTARHPIEGEPQK
jgi:hypothetical protein